MSAEEKSAESAKPLLQLTDEDIAHMTKRQFVNRLERLNPFGNYSTRHERASLEHTLRRYRDFKRR